ncbi:MAG: DUF6514 family protein [Oscillospiraceae bacterium]
MNKKTVWTREFTNIGVLQNAKTVYYDILFDEKSKRYGVEITEVFNDLRISEQETNIFDDKLQADNLLMFLYENAIGCTVLHDVIQDLKVMGTLGENNTVKLGE